MPYNSLHLRPRWVGQREESVGDRLGAWHGLGKRRLGLARVYEREQNERDANRFQLSVY